MALGIVAALFTQSAFAADNPRKLLAKGNQLFASGRYAEAFDVFKSADAASPSPVFLRSMAYCKLKLSQHKEAYELFDAYLKKYPNEKDAAKIRSTVKDLELIIATRISVKSTPPGAELYFDTEAAGRVGTTPYEGTIEPGKHIAILRMQGFETTTRPFNIPARSNVSLEIPLEVALKVTSTPPGATVHLDSAAGKPLGTTPYDGTIAPGKHTLFLRLSGYKTHEQALQVDAGPATVDAQMQLGMRIVSTPPGAVVEIDGTRAEGATPLEVSATPGKHNVTMTLPGFKPFAQTLDVAAGSPNAIDAKLEGGLLTMRTGPDGADVKVGTYDLGKTPLERVPVPMGEQAVVVKHPARRVWHKSLSFSDTELLTAEIKLGRPSWPAWTAAGVAVASLGLGIAAGLIAKSQRDDINSTQLYTTADAAASKTLITEGPDLTNGGTGRCNGTAPTLSPTGGTLYYNSGAGGVPTTEGSCSYSTHHAATAGFVTAGVSGAFSLLYYWLFVRPSEQIEHQPKTVVSHKQ